jgi:1,4-dihydroxy-6-naphthoate synthase
VSELKLAISPCPNDIFIFGAWILGLLPGEGLRSSFVFSDVEELNRAAEQCRFDVVKLSAVQALRLKEHWRILPSGGAFGLGHGPKLIALPGAVKPERVAVPGLNTTAWHLLHEAADWAIEPVPMRYDMIISSVTRRDVDGGLLIHESALVYREHGLELVLDLGRWWQERTGGLPLPLGVIAARHTLDRMLRDKIAARIKASLRLAGRKGGAVWPLVRAMAQELDDSVLRAHLDAYVNRLSDDFGEEGARALSALEGLLAKDVFSGRKGAAES